MFEGAITFQNKLSISPDFASLHPTVIIIRLHGAADRARPHASPARPRDSPSPTSPLHEYTNPRLPSPRANQRVPAYPPRRRLGRHLSPRHRATWSAFNVPLHPPLADPLFEQTWSQSCPRPRPDRSSPHSETRCVPRQAAVRSSASGPGSPKRASTSPSWGK